MTKTGGKWKQVFLFTIKGFFSGKVVKAIVGAMIAVPIILVVVLSMAMGQEQTADIEDLYVIDQSNTAVDFTGFAKPDSLYKNVKVIKTDDKNFEDFKQTHSLGEQDILCDISYSPEDFAYEVNFYVNEGGEIGLLDLSMISGDFLNFFNSARMATVGVDEEIVAVMGSVIAVTTEIPVAEGDSEVILTPEQKAQKLMTEDTPVLYLVVLPIIFCVMFAIMPVYNVVLKEKTNKIIEFMIISVSATQMIVGKVLAAVCYVLVLVVLFITSSLLAVFCSTVLMENSPVLDFLSETGITEIITSLGVGGVLYLLASFIATLLFYSFFAALLAATASRPEDNDRVQLPLTIVLLAGFYLTYAAVPAGGDLATFAKYFPFSSSFYANFLFAKGELSVPDAAIALITQIALVVIIVFIAGKLFKNLIIWGGETVKLGQLKSFWGDK